MQVGDLYDAILDEGAYAALPGMIAQAVGGRSSVVHRYERNHFGPPELNTCYFDAPFLADVLALVAQGGDIWTRTGLDTGIRNRAVAMHKLVPDDMFRGSTLFNEVFRKHGDDTGHSLGMIIETRGALLCVSSQRAWGAGAFGLEEEAALDALRVDLNRVFEARELIRGQQGRITDLTDMVAAGETRILVVGPDLELRGASPAGEAVLGLGDGLRAFQGRLAFADRRIEAQLRAAVRATIARAPVARTVFTAGRPSGAEEWRLRVVPSGRQDARSCLILIGADEIDGRDRQRLWLREHFGVTDSEALVAHGLVAGLSPEEIADERGVSKNTVRAQLRALMGKTGTSRMAELVGLLARVP
ncbi:hypothetical protein GCM10011380_14200 [Sphingomonas metalli]|uniref:HTH luxR-type domain-containing protein n=1 Tax=Sphingomonas metalli TaxID=1779358 RepID=A0A916WRG5_9SPHN|nr:helix-turn-helix transcriptional regulator [Sphingomonas metalli]GGB25782.1 hypothetical protein GCM10011380_14200 [Sphingomonas metalli]